MNLAQYESRLLALPCVACVHLGFGETPAQELHHVGDPGVDRDDWAQVGLCREHHRGPTGVHGLRRREFERRYKLSDIQMLAIVRKMYARAYE